MAKPTRLPCPMWMILDAPALKTACGPVYRCGILLSIAYWEAGCILPVHDDLTLGALCRTPPHVISTNKSEIIRALSEITPDLDKERARLMKARSAKVRRMTNCRETGFRKRAFQKANMPEMSTIEPAFAPAMVHEATTKQGASQRERERRGNAQPPPPAKSAATPSTAMFTDRPVIAPPEGGDDN